MFIASQEGQASCTGRENTRMQSNTWVHVTKLKPPSHFAWGHRGVSGAHKWLQNYELCVEVDGWVEKGSPRELQPWGLEKVDVA